MQCCGQERSTPFCPECGTPLKGPGLMLLLKHLRTLQSNYEKKVLRREQALKDFPGDESRFDKRTKALNQAKLVATKWKSWADELEMLLMKSERK